MSKQRTYYQQWLLASLSILLPCTALALSQSDMTGREIMQEVYERHEQFPHVYEEQVMILMDKSGKKNTRQLQRYSRYQADGNFKNLLLFNNPPELRGVGLLSDKTGDRLQNGIYLPAFGPQLIESVGENQHSNFLGTDFSVNDLMPEILDEHQYVRRENIIFDNMEHLVVDVYPANVVTEETQALRRHHIRADLYYITRTDNYDQHGRLHKQQTRHDLKYLGGHLWRANMILMEDLKTHHQTLIKITRRVFSRDYVPEHLFSLQWLLKNQPAQLPVEAEPEGTIESEEESSEQINISQLEHTH